MQAKSILRRERSGQNVGKEKERMESFQFCRRGLGENVIPDNSGGKKNIYGFQL